MHSPPDVSSFETYGRQSPTNVSNIETHCQQTSLNDSSVSSSAHSKHRKPRSQPKVLVKKNSSAFNTDTCYGSEPESEDDNEESPAAPPVLISRVDLALQDTPLDPLDFDDLIVLRGETTLDNAADEELTPFIYGPHDKYDFEWRPFPETPIPAEMRREKFSVNSGVVKAFDDPYKIFTAIWNYDTMKDIADETNRYAQQLTRKLMDDNSLTPHSRLCTWRDTNVDELYVYFALLLAMGMVVKGTLDDYWKASLDIFSTPYFSTYMSLKRFQILSKCLHFVDNESMPRDLDSSEAKLYKIKPLLTHLNKQFEEMYVPSQNLALDESLLQWKGMLDINQFIPNKSASVGIKSYEICESQTGYLWRFVIHTYSKLAPQSLDPLQKSTAAIVLRLTRGLEHKGYTLWMDNYYNSPALARHMKSVGIDCVGTLRTSRQYVPQTLAKLQKNNMRPGQITGFTSGDVDLIVWRDQNRVAMLSTYHGNSVSTDNARIKPILIHDYNIMMGGVDKKDQMLASYPVERKRTKVWYKKLFRRFLNVSVLNSYIIFKKSDVQSNSMTHRKFRTTLILSMLSKHTVAKPIPRLLTNPSSVFLVSEHYLEWYPLMGNGNFGRIRRTCIVCKKRSTAYCAGCNRAVCATACFRSLHTP